MGATSFVGYLSKVLLMMQILHDLTYQTARNIASIVYLRSCRLHIINNMSSSSSAKLLIGGLQGAGGPVAEARDDATRETSSCLLLTGKNCKEGLILTSYPVVK